MLSVQYISTIHTYSVHTHTYVRTYVHNMHVISCVYIHKCSRTGLHGPAVWRQLRLHTCKSPPGSHRAGSAAGCGRSGDQSCPALQTQQSASRRDANHIKAYVPSVNHCITRACARAHRHHHTLRTPSERALWATRCEISLHRLFTLSFGRLASIFNLSQTAYWKVTCRRGTDTHIKTHTHMNKAAQPHAPDWPSCIGTASAPGGRSKGCRSSPGARGERDGARHMSDPSTQEPKEWVWANAHHPRGLATVHVRMCPFQRMMSKGDSS